ncbi:putative DUF602 family protein [Blattamonas nauphoetae]|uniref:DUF602 family protein n=1 Tax=Blattamonas nauphoetae TaxID=2049346 RepID=A0ABQ9XRJ4_9EUKA|nr:putative DUF602 family protein [Blattamonas nauphoetae]
MGGDGGSFKQRTEMVKTKQTKKEFQYDLQHGERYFICSLSGQPLSDPIVVDCRGNMFNKETFLKEFLSNKNEVRAAFPHIRNPLKDLIQVFFTPNPAYTRNRVEFPQEHQPGPWVCPLRSDIEVNGKQKFTCLSPCGHALCDASVCEVLLPEEDISMFRRHPVSITKQVNCPVCSAKVTNLIPLIPTNEEANSLYKPVVVSTKHKRKESHPSINPDEMKRIESIQRPVKLRRSLSPENPMEEGKGEKMMKTEEYPEEARRRERRDRDG